MVQRLALAAMTGGMALLVIAAPAAGLQPCTSNCAKVTVGSVNGPQGRTAVVPISFEQGPDDSQSGSGNDDVAAIAFTLGIPGTGSDTPLQFDCVDGRLADNAVQPGEGIAANFTVVIENAECTNRSRCLCPTGDAQRDNFVNIVVYGPKDLPQEGPVTIPALPDTGELLSLRLKVPQDAAPNTVVPLHVFAETDNGAPALPPFAAALSIGDQAAADVTADRGADLSRVQFSDGSVTVVTGPPSCIGDCDGNGQVAINELITGVNIALGNSPLSGCTSFDANPVDGQVAINELISAVNNALNGCPA